MRLQNWESNLYAALEAKMDEPFAWGSNDCLLFVSDMVNAITGVDYAADFRGTYSDQDNANAIIEQLSGSNEVTGVVDLFYKRIPVLQARRGDIVARMEKTMPAVGICAGGGCYFVGPTGLFKWPLQSCLTAWRVT